MYVRTNTGIGQFGQGIQVNCKSGKDYRPPFSSAQRHITEGDAVRIFTILCGPSPWQNFLRPNLAAHLKDLPRDRPMRILSEGDFAERYRDIFGARSSADTRGFVDRRNAVIYLAEFPVKNYGGSLAGLALHEAVHLFSHPPGKSKQLRSTGFSFLGVGLIEGLTQAITEDIQEAQGIRPLPDRWQAYQEYTPVARQFIRCFSAQVVGDAYFNGNLTRLLRAIERRWTHANYLQVKGLVDQKKKSEALRLIESLEKAYADKIKPKVYRWVFR